MRGSKSAREQEEYADRVQAARLSEILRPPSGDYTAWEYTVWVGPTEDLERSLNTFGQAGWTDTSITTESSPTGGLSGVGRSRVVFKRSREVTNLRYGE
jgi:hypothetical protein